MDAVILAKVNNWLTGNYDQETKMKSFGCKKKIRMNLLIVSIRISNSEPADCAESWVWEQTGSTNIQLGWPPRVIPITC